MATTRYPIRIGARSRPLLRVLFGVTEERAWVELRDATVACRFGRFDFTVPLEDVVRWRIEGPWAWITAIGLRRSIRHGDISFAGSPRGGVRLDFRRPIPWFFFSVPAAYYGVQELDGFAAALGERGIPGEDARTAIVQ